MAINPRNAERRRLSIWHHLGALIAVVILLFYWAFHARVVAEGALMLAFPDWDVSFRSCWMNPLGGAWVSDIDMIPVDGTEEDAYHFDSLSIDVPILQYYRSGASGKKRKIDLSAIHDIDLKFSGGHGTVAWPLSSELAIFGNASASPFEAAGCLDDNVWTADEFASMGLSVKPTSFRMGWHRDGDVLKIEQSLETPGAGRVDSIDEFNLVGSRNSEDLELAASEWHVLDQGFVQARNNFCAEKDGVSTAEFVDRHVASVQRALRVGGLEATGTTDAAYRKFAEHGGSLDLVIRYSPAIDAAVSEDDDWGRWLARAHAELVVDGQTQRVGMRTVSAQPLPADSEDKTLYSIVQMERSRSRPAQEPETAASTVTEATGAAVAAADPATNAEEPELLMASPVEAVERPDTILDYRKLAAEKGQRFMVYLKGKSPMKVEVVGSEEGLVKVRRYLRSGWLEHTIARAGFERAVRIH